MISTLWYPLVVSVTRTHDVLKKARTNLEVRRLLHQSEARSLPPTHHYLLADLVGGPWPALAFQEKILGPLARSQVLSEHLSPSLQSAPALHLCSRSHRRHLSFLLQFFFFDAKAGDWRNSIQLTLEASRHSGVCL